MRSRLHPRCFVCGSGVDGGLGVDFQPLGDGGVVGQLAAGITDGFVRFAVGIEDLADLIADLEQALEKVP